MYPSNFVYRVDLEFPKIEVRFQDLTIESFVHTGSRALPTIPNFICNMTEVYSEHNSEENSYEINPWTGRCFELQIEMTQFGCHLGSVKEDADLQGKEKQAHNFTQHQWHNKAFQVDFAI